jgi:hypothetical protein
MAGAGHEALALSGMTFLQKAPRYHMSPLAAQAIGGNGPF